MTASTKVAPSSADAGRRMQSVRQKVTSAEFALRRKLHAHTATASRLPSSRSPAGLPTRRSSGRPTPPLPRPDSQPQTAVVVAGFEVSTEVWAWLRLLESIRKRPYDLVESRRLGDPLA